MNVLKSLFVAMTFAAASAAATNASADTTDVAQINATATQYVYPLQGGVDYNQKELRWKEVHADDVKPDLLGKNG